MENRQQFKQLSVSSLQFLLTSGKAISSSVLIINNIVCSDRSAILRFCDSLVASLLFSKHIHFRVRALFTLCSSFLFSSFHIFFLISNCS